jgi:type II secretion system protein I
VKVEEYGAMKNEHGFTLLEVLIALAIVGIGIIAVMQLFPSSLKQARMAAERTAAANVANSELGQLRSINNQGDFRSWLDANSLKFISAAGEKIYALYGGWQTSVQRLSDSEETYRVTFNVKMLDGRSETFVTYVTKR